MNISDLNRDLITDFYNLVLNDNQYGFKLIPNFIREDFYDHASGLFGYTPISNLITNRPTLGTFNILFTVSEDDKICVFWQIILDKQIFAQGIDIYRILYYLEDSFHVGKIAERWSCSF